MLHCADPWPPFGSTRLKKRGLPCCLNAKLSIWGWCVRNMEFCRCEAPTHATCFVNPPASHSEKVMEVFSDQCGALVRQVLECGFGSSPAAVCYWSLQDKLGYLVELRHFCTNFCPSALVIADHPLEWLQPCGLPLIQVRTLSTCSGGIAFMPSRSRSASHWTQSKSYPSRTVWGSDDRWIQVWIA